MTKLEERLRGALTDAARPRPTTEADWQEFESRLARGSRERREIRWRAPLIAAAAVVIIAGTTSAIVTGGFGIGGHHAANSGVATVPVTVPIKGTAVEQNPLGTVTLTFVGGQPPAAQLRWRLTLGNDSGPMTGHDTTSDGTPLGYVDVTAALVEGHRYLWGAVGPGVAQVQITAVKPPTAGDIDPGFHAGPQWTIDSGRGTPWSLPEAADVAWTDLGDGWHGFAVQLPAGTTTASVVALDHSGTESQDRQFDMATHESTDLPVAPSTVMSPAPNTAPAGGPPVIATYQDRPGEGGDTALLAGTVGVTDGCVTVTASDGTVVTPVFPAGQVGAAAPALFTFRGNTYAEGSRLSVSGGYPGPAYPGLPRQCPDRAFVINSAG